MARPFWKGSVSFGLVEIGVTLRPATAGDDLSFTLLDRENFAPVGYKRYNKRTGDEVPWNRVVRGYEYEPDQFVVLTDEELKSANPEASRTMEVVGFVERGSIDPIYFETPYFVDPQGRSSKSYGLLVAALEQTGLIGIVRVVLRTRQHVAALLPHDGMLMLDLLRYPEELREARDPQSEDEEEPSASRSGKRATKATSKKGSKPAAKPRKAAPPTAAELKLALRLVDEMRGEWRPQEFHDEYRQDVMDLIEKKVKSGKTHEILREAKASPERAPREVVDLMPLLKRSLQQRLESERRAGERRPPRPAARSSARSMTRKRKHA